MGTRVSKKEFLAGLARAAAEQPPVAQPAIVQPARKSQSDIDAISEMVAALIKKGKTNSQPVRAIKPKETAEPQTILLRVAAYIRVSSENENQEDSYETQEKYFTNLLAKNPSWASAGIYSDYGISATSDKNRVGFNRLLRHCEEGKIDRIIVKSISRFARNTIDFLNAMNRLKEYGVTILFEKEALDSADQISEFVLTTLAAIAQEESRSISSNIRWGMEARYPKGDVVNYAIYGYRYAEGDNAFETTQSGYTRRRIEIVEEEADVVKRVFEEAAAGEKYTVIAQNLNYDNIHAPPLKRTKRCKLKEGLDDGWTGQRISQMVKNERYCGDVKVQKSYTEDYLSHRAHKNRGEKAQYYIEDHHPAIISRELFEAAQSCRGTGSREQKTYPISGILTCAHCGRTYNVRNNRHDPIWFCPSTNLHNGKNICHNDSIYEEQIVKAMKKGMSARFGRDFVTDIRARLEHLQGSDFNESDRVMLKRRAQILFAEWSNAERKKKLLETKLQTQKVRVDVFGEGLDEVGALEKEIESCELKLEVTAEKEAALEAENDCKESYWQLLEENYKWRTEAIQWMKTLPEGREGMDAFIEGLTADHVKAFILSITVYDEKHFTIRWFDDVNTEVELYDVVEDHRIRH